MRIDRKGSTRIVLVFKKIVIKLPNFLDGYKLFLCGLLANINEGKVYVANKPNKHLAKIYYFNRYGLIEIMQKADALEIDFEEFSILLENTIANDELEYFLMDDPKMENWGLVHGELKKIDYGQTVLIN